jgi:hypothetical protein
VLAPACGIATTANQSEAPWNGDRDYATARVVERCCAAERFCVACTALVRRHGVFSHGTHNVMQQSMIDGAPTRPWRRPWRIRIDSPAGESTPSAATPGHANAESHGCEMTSSVNTDVMHTRLSGVDHCDVDGREEGGEQLARGVFSPAGEWPPPSESVHSRLHCNTLDSWVCACARPPL